MVSVRIKICGITNEADATMACRLGADAIGLNLYQGSKRHVSSVLAAQIATTLPPFVEPVALFVNVALDLAVATAQDFSRTIQWHGASTPLPPPAPWRFIPAFPIVDSAHLAAVVEYLDRCRAIKRLPAGILLDGHAAGQYGGTGQHAPWRLLADFQPGVPIILAGGLTADNVAEAIRIVRPFGVDVASGVEAEPGRKDADKLRRFIDAVHSV
jgi:phosphoribosylanthranilate isomerase